MDHALEQVGIGSRWNRLKKISCNQFAASNQTGLLQSLARRLDCMWQIKQHPTCRRTDSQNRRKQLTGAAPHIDDPGQVREIVGLDDALRREASQLSCSPVEDGCQLRIVLQMFKPVRPKQQFSRTMAKANAV